LGGFEDDLSDAREVFAGFVFVFGCGRAEPMKPDLLVKIYIGFRAFALMRVPSIEDAGAVGSPGGAAAAGGVLDAGNFIGKLFTRIDLEKVQGALLAAAFRQ